MEEQKTYIVYKRTSPSGHAYIGYTGDDMMVRWKGCVSELLASKSKTPLAYAIRKYGSDTWVHEILFETIDKQEALDAEMVYISLLGYYNVAKGGNGGLIGTGQLGRTWKIKDTSNMKGKKNRNTEKVKDGIDKISSGNNYQCRHTIYTPWGIFESKRDCLKIAKELYTTGIKNVILDGEALRRYLYKLDIPLNIDGRRTPKDWRGKTPRELGFDYILKCQETEI